MSSIPLDTVRAARSVFHPSNRYITVGDHIDELMNRTEVQAILQSIKASEERPFLWSLLTAFQYKERLNDIQAAEAARQRIEWRYALHLPSLSPSINHSLLCHFRILVYTHPESRQLLQLTLDLLHKYKFFEGVDSPEAQNVCTSVCTLNRYQIILESMQSALEILAETEPQLLRKVMSPYWLGRYRGQVEILGASNEKQNPETATETVGKDILYLVNQLAVTEPSRWNSLPEIKVLYQVLQEQFEAPGSGVIEHLPLKWSRQNCVFLNDEPAPSSKPPKLCHGMALIN